MSGCVVHRLHELVVGLTIVLFVSLILILWTGISAAMTGQSISINKSKNYSTTNIELPVSDNGCLEMCHHSDNKVPSQIGVRPCEDKWWHLHAEKNRGTIWNHWNKDILPKSGSDFEHFVLAKSNQNSFEDPLDEYSIKERHDTGHFRNCQSKVWDPHPQYEFKALGRKFHLMLQEDSSFVLPGVTITHVSENSSLREYPNEELGCFYTGYLKSEPNTDIAVSLCNGMTGYLRTSTETYLIKPTEYGNENKNPPINSPLEHIISRFSQKNFNNVTFVNMDQITNNLSHSYIRVNNTYECGMIDNEYKEEEAKIKLFDRTHLRHLKESIRQKKGRSRRSYTKVRGRRSFLESNQDYYPEIHGSWRSRRALPMEYFIEIMVVADSKMIEYHGAALASYILVLMNMVSRIYKDPSIGNPINIAVVKIKQVDQIFGVKQRGSDGIGAADMLRNFCHWQKLNNPHEPSPEHHDAALLLTRENLCHNPNQKRCDTLGLAELGRMCSISSSCAIVQDSGLATAFTIAHEIGHVLNMPHDDDPKCMRFRDHSEVHNIMSRMLDDNTEPWKWSKCSRYYSTEFLEAGLGNCLRDDPKASNIMSHSPENRLPGEDYSENQQCELIYGTGSVICPHMVNDVCKRLWCTVTYWNDRTERCHTQHMPWADGTVCAHGKWCHHGECISRENLEPVDGQWGAWKAYEECSRTCGGGIKRKFRECDNPAPKNGGNYCVGERVRYRSCSTEECPLGSIDFREEQCSAFDNDNRTIHNLTKNVKWHAKYTRIQPEDRCKLFCQVAGNQYYMLREKVMDGTPCGLDTFHICVNGYCKPAGCDRTLNSTATLDTCGVCRGDNSTCQRISGSYNISEYGYTKVTKIPAGSSYIDIKQYGWNKSYNDSNYLAVRLQRNGKYILNGNFTVMHRKVIIQPDLTLEYSGPEDVVERLNSSRPIHVDLILEVLSVGNVYPPQITYEYTVPKKILETYSWILTNWTTCDRLCQGISYRRARCQSFESKDVMTDDYCPLEKKPREQSQTCNIHCELLWQEVPNSETECSNHCGPGTLYVKYRCVQLPLSSTKNTLSSSSSSARPVPLHVCYHLERPQERRQCLGPCNYAHWQYGRWSECSVTCGSNGFQLRTATCVDADNNTVPESKCPRNEKMVSQACGQKSCPMWDYGAWSSCSVSCGIGKRERPYWCRVDNRVLHPSHCKSLPVGNTEICNPGPCTSWHTGEWTACSNTCGNGFRRRMVICKFANGTTSSNCNAQSKPIHSMSCFLEPCPTKATEVIYSSKSSTDDLIQHENDVDSHRITFRPGYRWIVEDYKKCSKSCGGGKANQVIKCISIETRKIAPSDDYCDIKEKPENMISCNGHQCPKWIAGGWSQCDVKCGDGYQHREVRCQDLRGEIINDSDCTEKRPTRSRKCQRPSCILNNNFNSVNSYKWRTGSWGQCSTSCGSGIRYRQVTCHRVNTFGWEDPSPVSTCSLSEKPPSKQFCKIRGCSDHFYWQPSNWRKCSQPCGRKGRQMRRLFCLDRYGRKVRRRHCPSKLRPQRKRKCNQKPCTGPTTCIEVQNRLNVNTDGEYTMLVGGRYMSIYCHGMETLDPQEYLTLATGERENYAEIYDKRLRDPHICPFDGRRNDSCDCITESVSISGRTMFKKVRINVHTLYIKVDDYTFSMKMGKNNIEYGKAGDCYSQIDCPQGRFGINLSGTFLMLAPEVHWPRQRNAFSIINKINNQRIIGKCGGYCGFCSPTPGLKLNVLPP